MIFDTPAHQKAVEALQLLLRKLPNKLAIKDQLNDVRDNNDDKHTIKQYEIPRDPVHIPQFKPIKPQISTTYTLQVGPIESVTKQTIGGNNDPSVLAAAAAAVAGGDRNQYTIKIQHQNPNQAQIQHLHSAPLHQTQTHSYQPPQPIHNPSLSGSGGYISEALNRSPLNLYHTMSLKNGPRPTIHLNQPKYFPPQSQPLPSLQQSHPHVHQQNTHAQQPLFYLPGEKRPLQVQGIQKSIEYRIQ